MKSKTFSITLLTFLMVVFTGITSIYARQFSRQDTLRGSITAERAWWDLTYYHLSVAVEISDRRISGSNLIQYKVLDSHQTMQIDLQKPLVISRITQNSKALNFRRVGSAFFIELEEEQIPGDINEITVYYSGKPVVAARPPWDGGFTWTEDSNGKPFVAT